MDNNSENKVEVKNEMSIIVSRGSPCMEISLSNQGSMKSIWMLTMRKSSSWIVLNWDHWPILVGMVEQAIQARDDILAEK